MSSAIKYSFVGILITAVVAIILWGGRSDPVVAEKADPPEAALTTPAKDEPNRWLPSGASARSAVASAVEGPAPVPSPTRGGDSPVRLVASGGTPEVAAESPRPEDPPAREERTPAVTEPERASGSTHVVASGESLFTIAKQHYGNGNVWRRIAEANPSVDPDKLRVGTRLVIPAATARGAASPPVAAEAPAAPPPARAGAGSSGESKTYVVEKGDSLYRIAQKFYGNGNEWRRIRAANSSIEDWEVRPGMKLVIPAR